MDIVERLRKYYSRRELPMWGEIDEAAAEIERLRAEVASTKLDLCQMQTWLDLARDAGTSSAGLERAAEITDEYAAHYGTHDAAERIARLIRAELSQPARAAAE